MNKYRLGFWLALVLFANRGNASAVLLETFAPEDASYASSGWVLFDDGYIGIRFATSDSTHLSGVVGTFWGSGNFFSAITQLTGPNDFPGLIPGFLPSDVLAYSQQAVNTGIGNPSGDNVFPVHITLDPGNYFVFFGATDSSSMGFMPWAPDLSKSNIPLSDYLEYSLFPLDPNVNGWFEFQDSGVRVALLSSAVPIPGAFGLFASGLLFLGMRRRTKHAANDPLHGTFGP